MNIGKAVAIFCDLDNEEYSAEEKTLAIYKVMNLETHNGVKKEYMLKAIKWLWYQNYEIDGGGENNELTGSYKTT